jgi:hypothetical protein
MTSPVRSLLFLSLPAYSRRSGRPAHGAAIPHRRVFFRGGREVLWCFGEGRHCCEGRSAVHVPSLPFLSNTRRGNPHPAPGVLVCCCAGAPEGRAACSFRTRYQTK